MEKIYLEQVELPDPHFAVEILGENGKKKRYVIEERGFQQKFKDFLLYLEKEGYVYGERESLWMMKEVLRKYRREIG